MIDDFLKMYPEEPHEVLVTESIANALDAEASSIKITIQDGTYTIDDDGRGMTESEFEENYHSLAFSTKTRGEGIGFAGVGAKLYLIFLEAGSKIVTETRSTDFHGASELAVIDGEPRWRRITPSRLDHNGTIYTVQLHRTHQQLLSPDKIMKIVQRHYNSVLLGLYGEKNIEVNDIEVPAVLSSYQFFLSPSSASSIAMSWQMVENCSSRSTEDVS